MYEWEIKGFYSKNIHRVAPKIFNLHIWVKQPQLIVSSSNRMVVILFSKILDFPKKSHNIFFLKDHNSQDVLNIDQPRLEQEKEIAKKQEISEPQTIFDTVFKKIFKDRPTYKNVCEEKAQSSIQSAKLEEEQLKKKKDYKRMKEEICAMFDVPKIESAEDSLTSRDKLKRTFNDLLFIKANDLNYSGISRSSDIQEDFKENSEVNQIKLKTYNTSNKNTGSIIVIF